MAKQLSATLLLVFLVITVLACGETVIPTLSVPDVEPDFDGTGTIFIWAIGDGDEELALSLLSERLQEAVAKYCEDGKVVACFNEVGLQDWGVTKDIYFLPDFSDETTAVYGVRWSTDIPIWFVLEIVRKDGEWRVDSWRGLIPSKASEGEIPFELFEGTDKTNLFPPEE